MKKVLDDLIAKAPTTNDGVIQVQLQINGSMFAGALRKGDLGYELLSVGQGQDRNPLMVKIYVNPECVDAVCVPVQSEEKKGNGIIIPGMS